jgi:hypothetical protein
MFKNRFMYVMQISSVCDPRTSLKGTGRYVFKVTMTLALILDTLAALSAMFDRFLRKI